MPKLPLTEDDWELYDVDGVKAVANDLTAAIQLAETQLKEGLFKLSDNPLKIVMDKHLEPLFTKYQKFGTGDSEPACVARNYLSAVIREIQKHNR